MAERAHRPSKKRVPLLPAVREIKVVEKPSNAVDEVTPIQMLVATQYARGATVAQLARKLAHLIRPDVQDEDKQRQKSRSVIRKWLATEKMRNIIWQETLIQADLDSPQVVAAVGRKAKRGRIDAARLHLELTGRHAPNTEITPAQVNVVFTDLPRPTTEEEDDNTVVGDADEVVDVEED